MSEGQEYHDEKYEKEEEKSEKEHEKDEKGHWEEKWHRDPLSAARWAIILIWAGIALLIANNLPFLVDIERLDGWGLAFAGAGVILLLEVVIRVLVPTYRRAVSGTLILAAVFLGIGLGGLFGWGVTGALVLIAVGAGILLRSFMRRG
jgi:hypothetical protein